MASQKPPVALVSSVTLIFSAAADGAAVAVPLALAAGAAVAVPLALAAGAAVAALLVQAAMSIAPAPSTTNVFSRVDMCVAPPCRIVPVGSAARAVRPRSDGSNGGAPSGADDPGHELLLVVRGRRRLAA